MLTMTRRLNSCVKGVMMIALSLWAQTLVASGGHGPAMQRDYTVTPPAPRTQSLAAAQEKSAGCESCHTDTDSASMHASPGVVLGCTDCHGGNAQVFYAQGDDELKVLEAAHVLPLYPQDWNFPASRHPTDQLYPA